MKPNLTLALAAALVLAGCSAGSGSIPSSETNPDPETTVVDSPTESIDCTLLQDPQVSVDLLSIQILAQLRNQGVVDSVKDGFGAYDPESMASTLEVLRVLAGRGVPGLGEPGEAIDFYLGANEIASRILAVDGPVPQELFDELTTYEGEMADFLLHQVAISAAIGENCD